MAVKGETKMKVKLNSYINQPFHLLGWVGLIIGTLYGLFHWWLFVCLMLLNITIVWRKRGEEGSCKHLN